MGLWRFWWTSVQGFEPQEAYQQASRRWQQGFDAAIHGGLGEEEAKKRTRESSQAASKEFVNLWLMFSLLIQSWKQALAAS